MGLMIKMVGVRDLSGQIPWLERSDNDRVLVCSYTTDGDETGIDLEDLISWLRQHMPEALKE